MTSTKEDIELGAGWTAGPAYVNCFPWFSGAEEVLIFICDGNRNYCACGRIFERKHGMDAIYQCMNHDIFESIC